MHKGELVYAQQKAHAAGIICAMLEVFVNIRDIVIRNSTCWDSVIKKTSPFLTFGCMC